MKKLSSNTKRDYAIMCSRRFSEFIAFVRLISVEPVIFFFMLGTHILNPTTSALTFEKICRTKFPDYVCNNISNPAFRTMEKEVVRESSRWGFYENVCFTIPATFVSLWLSAWADARPGRRRAAMLVPLVGHGIGTVFYMLNAVWLDWPLGGLLIGPTFDGFSGGSIAVLAAVFSYLSNVSSLSNRTVRVVVVESAVALAQIVGGFVSGVMLDHLGYKVTYGFVMAVFFTGALYVLLFLKEPPSDQLRTDPSPSAHRCCAVTSTECCAASGRWCAATVRSVPVRFIETWRFLTRPRIDHRRRYVVLLTLNILVLIIAGATSVSVYLFLKYPPLNFSQTLYGYYHGFGSAIHGLCLLVFIPLCKKVFKMRDTTLILIGIISSSAKEAVMGVSRFKWMVFLSPVAGFMRYAPIACIRSYSSQIVDPDEQGRLFALISAVESIGITIASTAFGMFIFPRTVGWFPGFVFIFGALLYIIPFAMSLYIHVDSKRQECSDRNADTEGIVVKEFYPGNNTDAN